MRDKFACTPFIKRFYPHFKPLFHFSLVNYTLLFILKSIFINISLNPYWVFIFHLFFIF